MTEPLRVYVNERALDAPSGATVAEAVALASEELGALVRAGVAAITDARGLPVAGGDPVTAGLILRVMPSRR